MVTSHGHKSWSQVMSAFLVRDTGTDTGIGTGAGTVIVADTVTSTAISKQ